MNEERATGAPVPSTKTKKPVQGIDRFKVPIYTQRILLEYSDFDKYDEADEHCNNITKNLKEHCIGTKDIRKKLLSIYHIDVSSDFINEVLDALEEVYLADVKHTYDVPHPRDDDDGQKSYSGTNIEGDISLEIAPKERKGNRKAWYSVTHPFDSYEMQYLVSTCLNSGDKSDPLPIAKKILSFASEETRNSLYEEFNIDGAITEDSGNKKNSFADKRYITMNNLLTFTYKIDCAIRHKKTISFTYPGIVNEDGECVSREYVPLRWENVEGYRYLAAFPYLLTEDGEKKKITKGGRTPKMRFYRIDRMRNLGDGASFLLDIKQLDNKDSDAGDEPDKQVSDAKVITEKQFTEACEEACIAMRTSANRMFGSHKIPGLGARRGEIKVKIADKQGKMKRILEDNFGEEKERNFTEASNMEMGWDYSFIAAYDGFSEWAMKFVAEMEVVSPPELRKDIENKLKHNLYVGDTAD